ncbi:DNA topoisomerase 2-associated protein pat1 [Termitomyces sp. T112]|nr:DNA topoisomerase 2-associated protein pat1 [Termitomyces sp. T112]
MSFFGFEQHDLEQEKLNIKDSDVLPSEDVAVYTWGEEGYDGLGDLLQEGRDELNDETFGDDIVVGKDFDFSTPAFPEPIKLVQEPRASVHVPKVQPPVKVQAPEPSQPAPSGPLQPPRRSTTNSLEAIWDDKSPFSVLPRNNGAGRSINELRRPSPATSGFSPFDGGHSPSLNHLPAEHNTVKPGIKTLQEIEAEMRATAQQSRQRQLEQQQLLLQQQEEALHLLQLQRERDRQQLFQQQEREYERQQILQYQEQQHQLQQRALQQQLQRTSPPRMLPGVSPSPRFLEHQRQLLLLQQQQEQQQRFSELQEQLRYEEMERQMVARTQQSRTPNQFAHRRHPSGPIPAELQAHLLLQQQQLQHQQNRRQRSRSPAVGNNFIVPLQEGLSYLPQNIQMLQQRMIPELAQTDIIRELHASSPAEQEAVRNEAMRKIVEAEKMEEKRRRKAAKIAHMARYNDLMTQSDKDFITRIQVSQLVTQDPYADDFYAQVYGAILRSRMGIQAQDDRVLKFNSGGGVGLGLSQKPGSRRPNAMLRMEQQVERIVNNARKREEEKGLHSLHSLQGALGKTSGRSYKAAPRQLLQVDAATPSGSPTLSHAHIGKDTVQKSKEGAAQEAAKLGREALGNAGDTNGLIRKQPLSHRQILVAVESLYDVVLATENIKRGEPSPEDSAEILTQWKSEYDASVDQLWNGLKVMEPLETSNPHPFISLLVPSKGKKILPRATRHLSHERMYTLLTLLVACFDQLDVVQDAHLLDSIEDTEERAEAERQSESFLLGVLHSILPVVARAELKLVTGLLGLLLDRTNIVRVAQSGAGIALLTLFLSRVEVIKQVLTNGVELAQNIMTPEEAISWKSMFDHLFQSLASHLLSLFPSSRMAARLPAGHSKPIDHADQPVWQLLAAIALHAGADQQSFLVTTLREKVLEIVYRVNKGLITDEDERQTKLANVNLFLHALGLDSSYIAL